MTPPRSITAYHILAWLIALILICLCVEASLDLVGGSRSKLPHYLNGIMVFGLVIALVILGFITCKARKLQQDIHFQEKQEMQREVDKCALRYKSLLEDAGDAIFVLNGETGLLEEMNRRGAELLGYSREELGRMSGLDLILAEDKNPFVALVRRVRRRGMAGAECLTFQRKDGSQFVGEVNARVIDLGDGRVVQAIIRDITQKQQAALEIRQRNRKLATLNNLITKANQSLDLNTVLEATLQEALEAFGSEGGMIHLLAADENRLALAARHNLSERFVATAELISLEGETTCWVLDTQRSQVCTNLGQEPCILARAAAADGWQSIVGIPLLVNKRLIGVKHVMTRTGREYVADDIRFATTMGNQVGIVIEHARMFAELHWKNEELLRSHRLLEKSSHQLALSQNRLKNNLALVERANEELERLDRMKSHFLGMISHEFRTPLTGILGGAEFLLAHHGTVEGGEARQLLEMIQQGGARLNEIVTDLLKVARLEASAPPLTRSTIHLQDILDLLISQFAPHLAERQQRIVCGDLAGLPYFSGDREYLEEVFTELLENASKFTPDGGEVVIAAQITDWRLLEEKEAIISRFNRGFYEGLGNACYLQVEVRDSGVGIVQAEQIKVFEKFYEVGDIRHHSTGKRKFQGRGAGLGLTIVKGMVEAHGGMVWVESRPDRPGSSFYLLLPLEEDTIQPAFPFMQGRTGPLPQKRYDQIYQATIRRALAFAEPVADDGVGQDRDA